jgi:hypothetical protein
VLATALMMMALDGLDDTPHQEGPFARSAHDDASEQHFRQYLAQQRAEAAVLEVLRR